jgi:hypothetical protein
MVTRRSRGILTSRVKVKYFKLGIFRKSDLGDSFNHVHDVWCIRKVLP